MCFQNKLKKKNRQKKNEGEYKFWKEKRNEFKAILCPIVSLTYSVRLQKTAITMYHQQFWKEILHQIFTALLSNGGKTTSFSNPLITQVHKA